MSKKESVHEIASRVIEEGLEPRISLASLPTVNLDEVTNEAILVKVRHHIEIPSLDEDGHPLLDEAGQPRVCRRWKLRRAQIQNVVPLSVYNQVIANRDVLTNGSEVERVTLMQDFVFQIWQLSEPWFTREMFSECVDFFQVAELFKRFFNESRLQNLKA